MLFADEITFPEFFWVPENDLEDGGCSPSNVFTRKCHVFLPVLKTDSCSLPEVVRGPRVTTRRKHWAWVKLWGDRAMDAELGWVLVTCKASPPVGCSGGRGLLRTGNGEGGTLVP